VPLRVGIVSRTATYWPLYLMVDGGDALELVELGSTAAGVEALVTGRVDVAATCPDSLIATSAPLRVAGGLVDRPPTTILARPGLRSVSELRGMRVATTQPRGSVSVYLRAALRAQGLAPEDYAQIVCGATPRQADALRRGVVDAAMLTFPFDRDLVAEGFVALVDVGAACGRCAFTTLNVRRGFGASAEWGAFRAGLARAAALLGDAPAQAAALDALGRATRISASAPPAGLIFDLATPTLGVERLIAFMRDDGVAVSGTAASYIEAPGE
jgi:ABC-type nitrate/sulfonate/bicarbonate transport system substrate-binding protein